MPGLKVRKKWFFQRKITWEWWMLGNQKQQMSIPCCMIISGIYINTLFLFVCLFSGQLKQIIDHCCRFFSLQKVLFYIAPPGDFLFFLCWILQLMFCGREDPSSSNGLEVSAECHQAVRLLFPGGLSSPEDVWEPPGSLTLGALEASFSWNVLRSLLSFDVKTWTMTFLRDFNVSLFLWGVAKVNSLWVTIC